ncbi:hypothetical protein K458DRAFT_356297 [Lentithecium fluviatile CBS 122367]|uniref:CENP-V/GFA domain-containing protein n=1 Tax=Lentithecium fluviatile CBS 122367 TaxID=1168545 RepID=A0A6G1JIB6_9PLEO|nr:hypothetical protein K458DRAFT_356297 [Lentithecium fluviatile CBS 122367]
MEGGCFCGKVRYSVSGDPVAKALCHCLDCRKITGSTYSTNAIFPKDGFKLVSGTPKQHAVKADSGNTITSHFCGDCGSTMWRDGNAFPGMMVFKVGTFDDVNAFDKFKPGAELFAPERVSWVPEMEGAAQKKAMS